MKEYFKNHGFSKEATVLVGHCRRIVDSFQGRGLRLTLRQLYYQLVVANIIPNHEKQYKKLSGVLSDARLMGLIDWSAIEDRIRRPRFPNQFRDLKDLTETAANAYRLDRWEGQAYYVELWVEKDALSGVLAPLANEYHVHLMVNRGYSSQTAMYDSGKRFLTACYGEKLPYETLAKHLDAASDSKLSELMGNVNVLDRSKLGDPQKEPVLLYLGDHDPSGEDMVRDIAERLVMFGLHVDVRKVALTMEQVKEYDPPPNPAKMTDPRAEKYVQEHGDTSWEVDALPPDALDRTIREALDDLVDQKKMDAVIEREERDKKKLRRAVSAIGRKRNSEH
jgi:hypothetical protein